ncbi:MAG TPA: BolA/IbaG family iron-sulfur metabolism protein [Candidatus Binataceae bacterium]|nr:BolA/IbaG family iron-sulfur metabolism protein [Candidatus Binataceae bacterium]
MNDNPYVRSFWNSGVKEAIIRTVMEAAEVKRMIEAGLPGAKVMVEDTTGGGDHFEALVVSEKFEGKGLVERHQIVYATLGDAMRQAVHALALKTLTPAQFENRR